MLRRRPINGACAKPVFLSISHVDKKLEGRSSCKQSVLIVYGHFRLAVRAIVNTRLTMYDSFLCMCFTYSVRTWIMCNVLSPP